MTAMFSAFFLELQHALRQLQRRLGYSALAVSVLASGLGATMYVMVVVYSLILKPLPVPELDRVVSIGSMRLEQPGRLNSLPSQDALDLSKALTSFEQIGGFAEGTVNLADSNEVARYDGVFVFGNLFEILGEQAMLGRVFDAADDQPGSVAQVLISEPIWRNRFAADPNIAGRSIRMNGEEAIIVGVLASPFAFPRQSEVWVTARYKDGASLDEQMWGNLLGRLKPGVSMETASAEATLVYDRLRQERMDIRRELSVGMLQLADEFVGAQTREILVILLLTAFSVLLLACANVANLQLGSLSARSREFAVRAAIGAGRGRIILGVLCESLVLAAAATLIALFIADVAGRATTAYFDRMGDGPGYWFKFQVDGQLVLIAGAIALLTTLMSGVVPALRASGISLTQVLNDSGQSGEGRFTKVSKLLVIGQITLSCLLLIGAGMTWRGLQARSQFDQGFDQPLDSVITARVGIFTEQYPTPESQEQFFAEVTARLRAEPGVIAVTASDALPGAIAGGGGAIIEGQEDIEDDLDVSVSSVDDYFAETYGIKVLQGRFFDARDTRDSAPVVVVDQLFVEHFWPGQEALNRRIKLDAANPESPWATIIGVIRPLQLEDVDDDIEPAVLRPMRQNPMRFVSIALRAHSNLAAYGARIAEVVRAVNADTPVYWVRTLEQVARLDAAGDRFLTLVFGIFGLVGLLLASAGLYGVLAQSVLQRTREIGVRRAIGAPASSIVAHVAGDAGKLVMFGIVLGLGLGVPWAMVLSKNATKMSGFDPLIFSVVGVCVLLSAAFAVLVPLQRAIRIDPMQALRYQ